jgi:hypothetical protein
VVVVTAARRRASRFAATAKTALEDPKVRAEARAAASAIALAGERARRVGVANARSDKKLRAHLHRAQRHATRAAGAARHPRSRHPAVRRTMIVTGAGALGGAAYAGWRAYGRPHHTGGARSDLWDAPGFPTIDTGLDDPADIPSGTAPAGDGEDNVE